MTEDARKKIATYYSDLWSGNADRAMADMLAPAYIEHQHTADFSKEGLRAYIEGRRRQYPDHRVIVHQILSEGELVFVMAEEKLGGNVDYARAELFRLQADGKIAEHWSSHVLDEKNRKNSRGTFDGSRVDRAKDYARRFGAQFEALDDRAFNKHELEAFHISRTPDYIQHSPKGRDGLTGLVEVLSSAKQRGLNFRMTCYHTLADGDFIVSHRLYDCDPPAPLMNHHTFDIFRLNSEGKGVEHWDVMDPVEDPILKAKLV